MINILTISIALNHLITTYDNREKLKMAKALPHF